MSNTKIDYLANYEEDLLINSFKELDNKQTDLIENFYYHFFKNEQIKKLFANSNLENQYNMFFASIFSIVNHFKNHELLKNELIRIGLSHVKYGVKIEYFTIFEESFIRGLEDTFKDRFTGDLRTVWIKALRVIIKQVTAVMR